MKSIYFGSKKTFGFLYRSAKQFVFQGNAKKVAKSVFIFLLPSIISCSLYYASFLHSEMHLEEQQKMEPRVAESKVVEITTDQKLPRGAPLWGASNENGSNPEITDINQENLGDCSLVASLGALIDEMPSLVTDLVSVNEDGSYKVSLSHPDTHEPVTLTVESVMSKDGVPHHASLDNGVAVAAIESAYNQLLNNPNAVESVNSQELPIKVDWLTGGRPEDAFAILTGEEPSSHLIETGSMSTIVESLSAGDAATIYTKDVGSLSAAEQNLLEKSGLLPSHVYVAVGIHESVADGTYLMLYNPHGKYTYVDKEKVESLFFEYNFMDPSLLEKAQKGSDPLAVPRKTPPGAQLAFFSLCQSLSAHSLASAKSGSYAFVPPQLQLNAKPLQNPFISLASQNNDSPRIALS